MPRAVENIYAYILITDKSQNLWLRGLRLGVQGITCNIKCEIGSWGADVIAQSGPSCAGHAALIPAQSRLSVLLD